MQKRVGRYWEKLNFQAVIKSAASAASPTAWGAPDDGARWDAGARPDDGTDSDDPEGLQRRSLALKFSLNAGGYVSMPEFAPEEVVSTPEEQVSTPEETI